jgi:hypothetical protein
MGYILDENPWKWRLNVIHVDAFPEETSGLEKICGPRR